MNILASISHFFQSLMPKDHTFFPKLEGTARLVSDLGHHLAQIGSLVLDKSLPSSKLYADEIKKLEEAGDAALRDFNNSLAIAMVTPFDKADMMDLAHALEHVLDAGHNAAAIVDRYNMKDAPVQCKEMLDLIAEATQKIMAAFTLLRNRTKYDQIIKIAADIKDLEKRGDGIYHNIVTHLFAEPAPNVSQKSYVTFIAERDFVEALEETLNLCSKVATTLNMIVVKHG